MKRESNINRVSSSNAVAKNRKLAVALVMGLAACVAVAMFVTQAYNSRKPEAAARGSKPQGAEVRRGRLHSRLAFQPQADRLRYRLGQRFLASGREMTTLSGTLTAGGQTHPLTIIRRQDDDGERISISLSGGQPLTWSGQQGALAGGRTAGAEERKMIERIVLDSPDQFILAQLRGASYYTVAKRVVPEEALQSKNYNGPAWDVVRVEEADKPGLAKPESLWRVYCINSDTGLIDRIISNEQGEPLMAEILNWSDQQGELTPVRIRWSRNNQVLMELVFTGFAFEAR